MSEAVSEKVIKNKKLVYLCGFMGCGKSYYGKKAERLFGCSYIDLDNYIVEKEGVSIPKIFTEKGVDYFRMIEYRSLCSLKEIKGTYLISLGGGTLTNRQCVQHAKNNANVIFINTNFETCYNRISNDPNRPNAFGKSKDELYKLYLSRIEIYKKCANIISESESEILFSIKEFLNKG